MSDGRENYDEFQQPQPRYEHYQVGQEEPDEEVLPAQPKFPEKREKTFGRKLGITIVLAVVFGLISGGVFLGIKITTDKFLTKDSDKSNVRINTVDSLKKADTDDVQKSTSGKGPVAEVAQATMPAVVAITSVSIQEIPSFFGFGYRTYQHKSAGSGSGIIVGENDEELFIATNNHVVEGAATLSVCFIGNDVVNAEEEALNLVTGDGDINLEDAVTAKIKGTDAANDLAVVTVKKKDIPEDTMNQIKIAQIGSSENLVVGEQVVAIGNALGYGQSVTSGWVSALDRTLVMDDGSSSDLIQTDAAINPGNSGGALLNMDGELIGINSAKYADSAVEGMGYAIPISKALPILEDLMNRETREKVSEDEMAYMGIAVIERSAEVIQLYDMPVGAFISEVAPGYAADRAGLQKGDIVVSLDGQKVNDERDLLDKLQYYKAGETIELIVARAYDGEYMENTLEVTFDSIP